MPAEVVDGNGLAEWHAREHLQTDPGIVSVHYLPKNSPDREIRLVEVNELIAERERDPVEPLDFGVDVGDANAHKLMVVDVTPSQWAAIQRGEIALPQGWSLAEAVSYRRP